MQADPAALRHVLVVEDEDMVRDTIAEVLTDDGLRVTALASGEALVELLPSLEEAPAALVIDVKLGDGIGGFEAARLARERFANLPVIYVSGDLRPLVRSSGRNDLALLKPFTRETLLQVVHGLIG